MLYFSAGQPAGNTSPTDPMWENVKKCKNFLSTLIKLAANQPEQVVRNVKQLIQGLIVSTHSMEQFHFHWQI